jgi:ElaB/YqjD/DUF883 family membrane-anchored ribosome-binding protein
MNPIRLALVLTCLVLLSCSGGDENAMKQEQLDLRSRLETAISDVDKQIDATKIAIENATEPVRENLNKKLDALVEARDDLKDNLDDVGSTRADEWDEFRRTVDRSLDNARRAISDART